MSGSPVIPRIVRHEWTVLRRSRTAWWAGGILLAATAYALLGGIDWQNARAAESAATAQEGAELLAGQREASAASVGADSAGGSVASAKTFVALPPGPLAAFSVGLADLYPERAEISIWKRPDTFFGRYQIASPLSLMAGRVDLTFIVLYLLPLVLLALSYDMLAAERERGSLALVTVQAVGLPRLLAAKLLARLALLTAFLVVAVGVGALAAGIDASAWPRLLGWLAVAWLYGAFWLAVAAAVAGTVRRAETSAAVLVSIWLAVVLIVPGLLELGVQAASPLPSRLELVGTMREASKEASKASAELLAEYYHEHPELAANGRQSGFMPAFYATERDVEQRLEPLLDDYERRLERQQGLVERWRFVSPAVLAQESLIDLAGSSLARQRDAAAQARDFLRAWHEALGPKIFLGQSLAPEDYDRLPTFAFIEPAPSARQLAGTVLGLCVPALLALVLVRSRLSRYPVAP